MAVGICYHLREAGKVTPFPPSPPARPQQAGGVSTMPLIAAGLSAQTPLTRKAHDGAGSEPAAPKCVI